jgi:hypothetical protein
LIKVKIKTYFDITVTGVTGHYRPAHGPFRDRAGHEINNSSSWNRARNQQRNWETLTQLISLRTQVSDVVEPVQNQKEWYFEFTTETEVFNDGTDTVGVLKADSDGVPMLTALDNRADIDPVLITAGAKQNIWFASETINIE